jgi:hypothetical protein
MDWARDFASNFVLKIEGILDVFQDFYKQKLKQKNRPRHKKEFLEVPCSLSAWPTANSCAGLVIVVTQT